MVVIFHGDIINRLICHSKLSATEEFDREVILLAIS